MQLLTPELYCISAMYDLAEIGHSILSRQLNFNLARRSGVLVNQIVSTLAALPFADDGFFVVQELDLDPDRCRV